MSNSIAILGDSSSASLGGYSCTYPHLLFDLLRDQGYVFCNYAIPGLTSSDAKALYYDCIKKENYDYLVIYLGNNESCFSAKKGCVSHLYRKIVTKLKKKSVSKMKNFYARFESKYQFIYDYNRSCIANTPKEFSKNIKSIVRAAKKNKTHVILINPVANTQFLSGAGLPNYLFFKLIGFSDKVAKMLKPSDSVSSELIDGIGFQETENHLEMMKCYKSILSKRDGDLLSLIAMNNLAVYYFSLDFDKCKEMLLGALNICESYNAIVYYNLYLYALHTNNNVEANEYLQRSCESDFSLYRIKEIYRNKLRAISLRYDITLLDMADFIEPNDFIDYCHPTESGHLKIANQLYSEIKDYNKGVLSNKISKAQFFRKLPSPNYLFKPEENYVDYYYIDADFPDLKIHEALSELISKHKMTEIAERKLWTRYSNSHLTCCLINFISSNFSHPIFNESLDISKKFFPYSHEILVMPENYLFRLLYNYYQIYESEVLPAIKRSQKFDVSYIESSCFYSKIILRNNVKPLQVSVDLTLDYYESVYRKLIDLISQSDIFSNTIDQRRRGVIFWYTRECFRYGTHSRLSMLYDRPTIDYCIESIIVLITISFKHHYADIDNLFCLLQSMQLLIASHERHVLKYHNNTGYSVESYVAELSQCKERVLNSHIKSDMLNLS